MEKLLVKAEAGAHKLLLCAVNWGEIYYNTLRKVSQKAAEQKAKEVAGLTIEIVGVDGKDLELVRQAAIYKATKKLSYADACVVVQFDFPVAAVSDRRLLIQ